MKLFSEKYNVVKRIYSNELSCAHVVLLEDKYGTKYAGKETLKSRLKSNFLHEFAKNEMALHYSLSKLSKSIVKVEDYFEDDEKYLMVMEFSYEPNYFEDLLENVRNN
jgi:serine/threonine protein kinase